MIAFFNKIKYLLPLIVNIVLLIPTTQSFFFIPKPTNSYDDSQGLVGLMIGFFILPLFLFIYQTILIYKNYLKLNSKQILLAYFIAIYTNPYILWFAFLILQSFAKVNFDFTIMFYFVAISSLVTNFVYYIVIPKQELIKHIN